MAPGLNRRLVDDQPICAPNWRMRGRHPHDDPPDRSRRPTRERVPVPTLGQLRKEHCWFWVFCSKCPHRAPMAVAPLVIRWGADASSDKLRASARCTKCGTKGATLQHPSWVSNTVGCQPFPVGR
jgi:hypothetical protein